MANVIVQRFIGGSQQLQYCSHIQPEKPLTDIISEPFLDDDSTGSFSSVDMLSPIQDAVLEGGSIFLAFLAVGCVGIIMFYMVNGVYVLSYILIQLLVGDGRSTSSDNKMLIYQLIYDQILLHRLWRRSIPSSPRFSSTNTNMKPPYNLQEKVKPIIKPRQT